MELQWGRSWNVHAWCVFAGTIGQVDELLAKYKQTDLDFGINKDVFKELVGDAVDAAGAEAIVAKLGSGRGVYVVVSFPPNAACGVRPIPLQHRAPHLVCLLFALCGLFQYVCPEFHLWCCADL